MKRVIMVSAVGPYREDPGAAEVWAVNRAFRHQPNATRLYFMDDLEAFEFEFAHEVAELDIPVVCRRHVDMIPRSEPYPLAEILDAFGGIQYFTSTTAYMLADAIRLGFEDITLHRFMEFPHAEDYAPQKPCLDFWCGMALGRGIRLRTNQASWLCKPLPEEPALYGYQRRKELEYA